MESKHHRDALESIVAKGFVPASYKITRDIELDPALESVKYKTLVFSLNDRGIVLS